jgi:hypothetical protein
LLIAVEGDAYPGVVPGWSRLVESKRNERNMVRVMNTSLKNRTADQVRAFLTGIKKHYPDGAQTVSVGGASYTVTALTQLMQSFVDNRDAVESAKAATKTKIDAERASAPSQLAVIRAFETVVRGTFGSSADALGDFGLSPPRARSRPTAEAKAVAAAKRQATRQARHTMGKNQKKGVKGAISASLVVTPTSSASEPVATTVSPAPSGSTPPAAAPTVTAAPTTSAAAVSTVGTGVVGAAPPHA